LEVKEPDTPVLPPAAPPEGGHPTAPSAHSSTPPSEAQEKPVQDDPALRVRLRHQEQAITQALKRINNHRFWGINE